MHRGCTIVGRILNELMQQLEGPSTNVACKLSNCRKPGAEVHIPEIVVEAEHAKILRDRKISLLDCLQYSEQQLIVAGQDRGGRVGQTEQAMTAFDAIIDLNISGEEILVENGQV